MFNFLHSFLPSPVLWDLGIIQIHWYGLLIAAAVFLCFWLGLKMAIKAKLNQDQFINLVFYLVIFGLLGARLWHVLFYNFAYFFANPWAIFKIWQGGLAIYGAIVAGLIVLFVYCRKHRLLFWNLADILAMVLPLGQAIGRWGNYFNQELFGLPCNFNWCIPIAVVNRPEQFINFVYFHPVFLYESILCFLLFAYIWLFLKNKNILAGSIALFYLGGYALIRFFTEFLRLDSVKGLGNLTWVQWFCLAVFLITTIWYLKFANKKRRLSGGTDGTRTRDLLRDREAL